MNSRQNRSIPRPADLLSRPVRVEPTVVGPPASASSSASEPDEGAPAAAKGRTTPLDRGQILDATAECLHENGYDGTTIRKIAGLLGCAVGSIYRYFEDKRELLDAVCQRRFHAVAEHAELGTHIAKTARLYLLAAAENPELYRLMFWLASVGRRESKQPPPAVVARVLDGWTDQLGSYDAAVGLWGQLHGGIMLGLGVEATLDRLTTAPHPTVPTHHAATATPSAKSADALEGEEGDLAHMFSSLRTTTTRPAHATTSR